MYGYYYSAGKAWNVTRLWEAIKNNEVFNVNIDTFIATDIYWDMATFKDFAKEMELVLMADYSYPIILDEQHKLIDGAHRIVHAYLDKKKTVKGVIISKEQWPEPDYDEEKAVKEAGLNTRKEE